MPSKNDENNHFCTSMLVDKCFYLSITLPLGNKLRKDAKILPQFACPLCGKFNIKDGFETNPSDEIAAFDIIGKGRVKDSERLTNIFSAIMIQLLKRLMLA